MEFPIPPHFRVLFPALLLIPFVSEAGAANNPLDPWQWQNRILLIDRRDAQPENWLTLLRSHASDIEERHLIWFMLTDSGIRTNTPHTFPKNFSDNLQQRYFSDPEIKAVLIGKDGGLKMRQAKLDLEEIFARIDSMPMRRAEMRRQE